MINNEIAKLKILYQRRFDEVSKQIFKVKNFPFHVKNFPLRLSNYNKFKYIYTNSKILDTFASILYFLHASISLLKISFVSKQIISLDDELIAYV